MVSEVAEKMSRVGAICIQHLNQIKKSTSYKEKCTPLPNRPHLKLKIGPSLIRNAEFPTIMKMQVRIQYIWGGARDSAFFTSSQNNHSAVLRSWTLNSDAQH